MLGYVKADKKSMLMSDWELYRGIYCSLCHSLGRNYSVFARLLLSYDFTLAAVLKLALSDSPCTLTQKRCPFNPAKKCYCCKRDEIDYCAHGIVIIAYYKILDNIGDRGFFKKLLSLLAFPFVALMHKKAKRKAPDVEDIVSENMKNQAQTEEKADCSLDEAAHYSSDALGRIFALGYENEAKDEMYRLGYMTGRFVYILDAADDLEDDIKKGNFNPFKKEFPSLETDEERNAFADRAEKCLNLTHGTLLEYRDKLKLNRFASIIENVLFPGIGSSGRAVIDRYRGIDTGKNIKSVTIK